MSARLTPASIAPASGPATSAFAPPRVSNLVRRIAPGVVLCIGVTLAATLLERLEAALLGGTWLEALVLAILVGTAVRTAWNPGRALARRHHLQRQDPARGRGRAARRFAQRRTILAAGPALLVGIAGVVVVAILASYGIGRLLGLPHRMAMLVACGNSICGNSAIAAVAPVIGADGEDVAASIAFTAVLGVVVVLGLPLLAGLRRT